MNLSNNTAGSLSITLLGSTAVANYIVPGTGGALLSPAPNVGKTITVPANSSVEATMDDYTLYLQGAVTVVSTAAAGLILTVVAG
jgi:hypothetical protein